jgi:hypothetical protein
MEGVKLGNPLAPHQTRGAANSSLYRELHFPWLGTLGYTVRPETTVSYTALHCRA